MSFWNWRLNVEKLEKQVGAESLMFDSHGTLSMVVEGFLQGRRGKWHDFIK